MKTLTIVTPDIILILAPTPASRLLSVQILLEACHEVWKDECGCDTQVFLDTMTPYLQQIADLIPRVDTPIPVNGFDIRWLSVEQVTALFFYQSEGEQIFPSQLIELHQPRFPDDSLYKEPPSWGDDISDWTPPVESCGDVDTDLLAMLSVAFKASGAIRIFTSYDRETINLWVKQYNAYSEPAKERRDAYIAKLQAEYKQQNTEIYREAMGLDNLAGQIDALRNPG